MQKSYIYGISSGLTYYIKYVQLKHVNQDHYSIKISIHVSLERTQYFMIYCITSFYFLNFIFFLYRNIKVIEST